MVHCFPLLIELGYTFQWTDSYTSVRYLQTEELLHSLVELNNTFSTFFFKTDCRHPFPISAKLCFNAPFLIHQQIMLDFQILGTYIFGVTYVFLEIEQQVNVIIPHTGTLMM